MIGFGRCRRSFPPIYWQVQQTYDESVFRDRNKAKVEWIQLKSVCSLGSNHGLWLVQIQKT